MPPIVFLIIFINILFELLSFTIIARVVLSWFQTENPGAITRFLITTTEPILGMARRITPRLGILDLSPIVALLGLDLLKYLLTVLLERV